MTRLAEKAWEYTVWEHDGRILLDVVCGTSAVFHLMVELTPKERAQWDAGGAEALQPLVGRICSAPERYAARRVEWPR